MYNCPLLIKSFVAIRDLSSFMILSKNLLLLGVFKFLDLPFHNPLYKLFEFYTQR
jgi:hypothetical protein